MVTGTRASRNRNRVGTSSFWTIGSGRRSISSHRLEFRAILAATLKRAFKQSSPASALSQGIPHIPPSHAPHCPSEHRPPSPQRRWLATHLRDAIGRTHRRMDAHCSSSGSTTSQLSGSWRSPATVLASVQGLFWGLLPSYCGAGVLLGNERLASKCRDVGFRQKTQIAPPSALDTLPCACPTLPGSALLKLLNVDSV